MNNALTVGKLRQKSIIEWLKGMIFWKNSFSSWKALKIQMKHPSKEQKDFMKPGFM